METECNCCIISKRINGQGDIFYDHTSEVCLVDDLLAENIGDDTHYHCSQQTRKSWREVKYPIYRFNVRKFECNNWSTVDLYPLSPWMEGVTAEDFISILNKNFLMCKHRQIILTKNQYNLLHSIRRNEDQPIKHLRKLGFLDINEMDSK